MITFSTPGKGQTPELRFLLASDRGPSPEALDGLQYCLRAEYGDTYVNQKVYDRAWLEQETAEGRLLCATVLTPDGDAAACLCLREDPPFPGVGDLCMHVVMPKFRAFGIGKALVAWLLKRPEAGRFTGIGSHNAVFHVMSQKESYAGGLRPCGMRFNHYISEGFRHSHANVGEKLSYVLASAPRSAKEALLCPPEEHRDCLLSYYAQVGIPVRLLPAEEPGGISVLEVLEDPVHRNLTVTVARCGADLGQRISGLMERRAGQPLWTANAFLELSDPGAPWGCAALEELGFFFGGIQPFCVGGNYLLLHHPMGVDIPFDQMRVTPEYEEMFRYIRTQYAMRRTAP